MKKAERGMVKYAPYQSLVEQSTYLASMRKRRQQVEKKVLLEDEAERINEVLSACDGSELIVSYWDGGFIRQEEGVVNKIDPYRRLICVNDTWISLRSLQSVERK